MEINDLIGHIARFILTGPKEMRVTSPVLIVDDDLDLLEFLRAFVESCCTVPTLGVADGGMVLSQVRSEQPALILLDVNLPVRNGWEVLADLKAEESTRSIPIIMMSAGADPGNERRALSLGAAAFVDKPFDLPELETLIHVHVPDPKRCTSIGTS